MTRTRLRHERIPLQSCSRRAQTAKTLRRRRPQLGGAATAREALAETLGERVRDLPRRRVPHQRPERRGRVVRAGQARRRELASQGHGRRHGARLGGAPRERGALAALRRRRAPGLAQGGDAGLEGLDLLAEGPGATLQGRRRARGGARLRLPHHGRGVRGGVRGGGGRRRQGLVGDVTDLDLLRHGPALLLRRYARGQGRVGVRRDQRARGGRGRRQGHPHRRRRRGLALA